ncbi:alpha-N-acetylglucosaminidase-like, partial [Ctenocephalides felis]|uniref:alpha-N-acetylglucosaminidase-like n=1 Tax=Ctenocephalides felis TaxID=7515 RepID=UPI000E6E2AB0
HDLLNDIEEILACNEHFLLSTWLEDAKSSATNDQVRFEYNARNQITLWGPNGEIVDYANKQWSGIVSDYFKPRWTIFYDDLIKAVKSNVTVNENAMQMRIFKEAEEPFTFSRKVYPRRSTGRAIEVSRRIFNDWMVIKSVFQI